MFNIVSPPVTVLYQNKNIIKIKKGYKISSLAKTEEDLVFISGFSLPKGVPEWFIVAFPSSPQNNPLVREVGLSAF